MDEIEYKLESKNPVLISHAISKLFESIEKKSNDPECKISNVTEFKLLLSKRNSEDPMVSTSVWQALIALVEKELWDVRAALSTLTSSLSSPKNDVAVATAITHFLILDVKRNKKNESAAQFNLHVPQHPFIVILSREKNNWQAIYNQMKYIMNCQDVQFRENSIETLRPVFFYILCNPSVHLSDGCKQKVWQLLIKSDRTIELQLEVLLWLSINEGNICTVTNDRVLELTEVSLQRNKQNIYMPLLPIIASLVIQLLKHGSDPEPNLNAMTLIIVRTDNCSGNIILTLMAEVITSCPAIYLYGVFQICLTIVNKMVCDDTFLYTLVASVLKWMAYPSILCSSALDLGKELIEKCITKTKSMRADTEISNKIFVALSHFDPYVQFYAEIVNCLNTWTTDNDQSVVRCLKNIALVPIDLRDKYKLLLSGLFLKTNDPQITELTCNILIEISKEVKSFASHVLSLILHKLTKSRNSKESQYLLLAVPELVTAKENIPIITHTLDTLLKGDKQLKYFAIELYLKTLQKEPRCYRFISAAIIRTMKTDTSWYSYATCARAMNYICENHSEHGETLVPLLSEILNRCRHTNGGTASALALKSISALCKSSVIGICSTWRVLAPKMEKERRAIVLESLCEFFGDIPSCPSQCIEEYDKLVIEILSNLWKYVDCSDPRVAEAALKALTRYRLEQIPLNTLPADFRCNLVLPASYAKLMGESAKPEDVIPYIPGTCWIQMLQRVHKKILSTAGDLLISFIQEEVRNFRSGIYIWPQGEPRNFKYLPEKSVIRGVGEFLRRCDKSDGNNKRVIVECLRIFAHEYSKPLPNINWSFLEETMSISVEAKEYSLLIACHHTTISLSARTFIENYLAQYKSATDAEPMLQSKEYLILYSSLKDLCQAIPPNNLKSFLEITLEHVIEKIMFGSENAKCLFDQIMSAYARALKNPEIDDGDWTILSTTLEQLLGRIDLTNNLCEPYFTAALELSSKHLESMTCPNVSWESMPVKLKNIVAVRAELAMKKSSEKPLAWLSMAMNVASSNASAQTYFLEYMQKVQTKMRFEKSAPEWILEFIAEIEGLITESYEENSNKINFYINIFFVSVICLSGVDCMLTDKSLITALPNIRARLFPQAVAILCNRQDWERTASQIMEWLNYMRTSPIPDTYKLVFHRSLISLRHTPHYRTAWTKYLSIKTLIDI